MCTTPANQSALCLSFLPFRRRSAVPIEWPVLEQRSFPENIDFLNEPRPRQWLPRMLLLLGFKHWDAAVLLLALCVPWSLTHCFRAWVSDKACGGWVWRKNHQEDSDDSFPGRLLVLLFPLALNSLPCLDFRGLSGFDKSEMRLIMFPRSLLLFSSVSLQPWLTTFEDLIEAYERLTVFFFRCL